MLTTTLYACFAATGAPLYVGITNGGPTRIKDHAKGKDWWPEVVTVEIHHFARREEARAAEAAMIRRLRPAYNQKLEAAAMRHLPAESTQRIERMIASIETRQLTSPPAVSLPCFPLG